VTDVVPEASTEYKVPLCLRWRTYGSSVIAAIISGDYE
jgi:hypothetical protein